ncbi:MAG: MBL fold metallo-hydrolase [Peptococcaceae bacterium]
MIREISPNLYKIDVPLPQNPLKSLNSYIIKGPDRNLIIDTGFNREECENALTAGLHELGINLSRTDFFITHLHADHSGLIGKLAGKSAAVYCSKADGLIIGRGQNGPHWEEMSAFARLNGFPAGELHNVITKHPGYKYCAVGYNNFTYVQEKDLIEIAGYRFYCVETPGHTRGHICLYDPGKKILISGDHILSNITPNISLWSEKENPLKSYLRSLEKIYQLDIILTLPGHRNLIENCRERIDELKIHHRDRLDEVMKIVEDGPKNACQVAAEMKWSLSYPSWEQFPTPQKWFALGEAAAHLKYLVEKGELSRQCQENTIIYSSERRVK